MNGNKSPHDATDKVGKQQSRNLDSVGAEKRVESEEGRSTNLVLDRQPVGASTISVSGSDRGAENSQGPLSTQSTQSPLAQMHRLIEKAGEEPFPSDIIRILSEPINDSLVDIRPDGLIFVSHPHYRDRLDAAFGVGGWALVPLAAPRVQDNRALYYGFLKARGQYVGDAVGGNPYYPGNAQGSYDNSVEGAKSDCLVRCCKALPMFRECWDKDYGDYWKSLYATEVAMPGTKSGRGWKKNKEAMRNFDVRPGRSGYDEFHKPPRVETENQAHIDSIPGNKPLRILSQDEHDETEPDYYDREGAWADAREDS